jgi:pathogenesis-related protein 1
MNRKPLLAVALALFATSARTDPVDAAAMLAAHNQLRSEVGVADLRWSDTLQQRAEKWAAELKRGNDCRMKHSEFAENLYWAGPTTTANAKDGNGNWIWQNSLQAITEANVVKAGVAKSWGSEKQWYEYASNTCSAPAGDSCGHYTQVVWRDSQEVGCAKAVCDDYSQVWVCNYEPAGNVQGQKPY